MVLRMILSVLTAALLFAGPLLALGHLAANPEAASHYRYTIGEVISGAYAKKADAQLANSLSGNAALQSMQVEFRRFAGETLQDGVFITPNGLYKNIHAPVDTFVDSNINGMLEFVYRYYIPTYSMLVPTACAIKQHDIPEYAQLFDQKKFIDDTYKQVSGVITSVDVYSSLFSAMDQYLYYRTHPALTGLGGHYIYTVLGDRLGIQRTRALSQYAFDHVSHDFYGSLYQEVRYNKVEPDTITLYDLYFFNWDYQMTRYEGSRRKTYKSLYFPEKLEGDQKLDVIFGGPCPRIDIRTQANHDDKLLIFADDTSKAFVPFLANHYGQITLVDLSLAGEGILDGIRVTQYDQILFAYSLDTFTQTDMGAKLLYLAGQGA